MDWWTLVIVLVLAGLSLLAYAIGALDRGGAVAAFVLGLVVALAGGLRFIFLMAAFTAVGVLATRFGFAEKRRRHVAEGRSGERGAANVIANGGAAALASIAMVIPAIPQAAAATAFATAVAAVTADTLASELGSLQAGARSIMPPFRPARAGQNGAVSLAGHAAAAGGAVLIGVLAVFLLPLPWQLGWIAAAAGFLGCQLDSVLGATLEKDEKRDLPLSKQDVNFIASAVPGLLVLVLLSL